MNGMYSMLLVMMVCVLRKIAQCVLERFLENF